MDFERKEIFDTLFLCGFHEKFLPELSHILTKAISGNVFLEDTLLEYDPSYLIIVFKGLVLTEAALLHGRMHSAAPAKEFERFLRVKLSPFLYNELAIWTTRNLYKMQLFYRYNPQPVVLRRRQGHTCEACNFYDSVPTAEQSHSIDDLQLAEQKRNELIFFEMHKCPICQARIVQQYETRWGSVKACSNYPVCAYIKKI